MIGKKRVGYREGADGRNFLQVDFSRQDTPSEDELWHSALNSTKDLRGGAEELPN